MLLFFRGEGVGVGEAGAEERTIRDKRVKAGVHVKAVLTSLNRAFLPISRSRFKQR